MASKTSYSSFHFLFEKKNVVYEWGKTGWDKISYEKLFVDDVQILEYSHTDSAHRFCNIEGCESLAEISLADNQSFVKFLKINTIQNPESPIALLVNFAAGMLYFKSLINGNRYLGFTTGVDSLDGKIIQNGKLNEFQEFLKQNGLNYKLASTPS